MCPLSFLSISLNQLGLGQGWGTGSSFSALSRIRSNSVGSSHSIYWSNQQLGSSKFTKTSKLYFSGFPPNPVSSKENTCTQWFGKTFNLHV